jgi:hypothetical protein
MNIKILTPKNNCLLLLLLAALIFCGCERKKIDDAQKSYEIIRPYEKGALSAIQKTDKSKMNLADLLEMRLIAVSPAEYEVEIIGVESVLGDFSVSNQRRESDHLDPNNNIVRTYIYQLEPFANGILELPAITFAFSAVGDDRKTYEIFTEPLEIEVVTTIFNDPNEPVEIADIKDVVEMRTNVWIWMAAGIVIAALFVVVATYIYSRKKRQASIRRIYKPAHEIAMERLAGLEKENLIIKGLVKLFYEKISSILRHYVEDRFDLNAPERTTEEFLAELKYSTALNEADKLLLAQFLEKCDLVKFAKHQPEKQQVESTLVIVRDFVEKTKSQEKQIDVTDNDVSDDNTEDVKI